MFGAPAVLLAVCLLLVSCSSAEPVLMPDLVGKTVADARTIVEDKGWIFLPPLARTDAESRDYFEDDREAEDDWVIISQIPDPGDETTTRQAVHSSASPPAPAASPSPSPSRLPSTTVAGVGVTTWAGTGQVSNINAQSQLLAEDIETSALNPLDTSKSYVAGVTAEVLSATIQKILNENPRIAGAATAQAYVAALTEYARLAQLYDEEAGTNPATLEALVAAMGALDSAALPFYSLIN